MALEVYTIALHEPLISAFGIDLKEITGDNFRWDIQNHLPNYMRIKSKTRQSLVIPKFNK